jgi:hypothetical protein
VWIMDPLAGGNRHIYGDNRIHPLPLTAPPPNVLKGHRRRVDLGTLITALRDTSNQREMARPRKHDGVVYKQPGTKVLWMNYLDRDGKRIRESTFTEDWQEANKKLRERLDARGQSSSRDCPQGRANGVQRRGDFFLENYSKPPIRADKTHNANMRASKHLKGAFQGYKLADLTADGIELYLRRRLRDRVRIKTTAGFIERGELKPATVHQELRVLRRMLKVAVRKKLLPSNPCAGVEFLVAVKGLFRPHYLTWSEQRKLEINAPEYLRNIVRIITETGLRVYKELMPMKKQKSGSRKCGGLDSRFHNTQRSSGGASNADGCGGFSRSASAVSVQSVSFSERREPERTSEDSEDRLERHLAARQGPVFRIYDLPSTYALGSEPAALPTSGSHSCWGRKTRRFSRNTRK